MVLYLVQQNPAAPTPQHTLPTNLSRLRRRNDEKEKKMIIRNLPPYCGCCVFESRPPAEDEYVRWQTQYRHVACQKHRGQKMPRPK